MTRFTVRPASVKAAFSFDLGAAFRRPVRRAVAILTLAMLQVSCASPAASPHQVSHSQVGAFEAALTAVPGGAIAAWYDTRDGNGEIYIRHLDSGGNPDGPERRLTTDSEESYEPSIAVAGDAVAVAWYDKAGDGSLTARLGLWSQDGTRRWVRTLAPRSRNPVVCATEREIVVSWIQQDVQDNESVWLGTWDLQGAPGAPPRPLGPAHKTTWNVNAAVDDGGRVWVAFDAVAATQASELFLARADERAVSLVQLTPDDGRESKYPDIAMRDGRIAVTWFDAKDGNTEVYLVTGTADEFGGAIDRKAVRVTETAGNSIGAYLTWNGDRLGLAWSDDTLGQHEVYFQPFDAGGRALAAATRLTSNSMSSLIPAIEPWSRGFALAWNEFVPGSSGHDGKSEIAFAIVP
jgi:hypothetical protein